MSTGIKHYIYVLRPVSRLMNEKSWTTADNLALARHLRYLKDLLKDERLLLAGRTADINEKTFGIVIFEAKTKEEAYSVMMEDPALIEGIMEGEVYPYKVALMSGTGGLEL